jgi:choline kinase
MNLLILAAGRSSRLYNKLKINKCLLNINNEDSLLSKIIDDAKKLNFKKVYIVTGFKRNNIEKIYRKNKFVKLINNHLFHKTDMVYSIFLGLNIIQDDTIITYSDILYDKRILKKLAIKEKIIKIPVKKNWEQIWRIRKKLNKNDAENLVIKKNFLVEIGNKILREKKTKYQFMGLVYFPKDFIKKSYKLYIKIKNKNIQTTAFLNYLIANNIKIKTIKTNNYWYEFDDFEDILNFNTYAKKIKNKNYFIK